MDLREIIKASVIQSGMTEAGFVEISDLQFYPEIRKICQENTCRNYGKTWACPPGIGTLEQCWERVNQYSIMLLFSKKFQLEDSFDLEGMTAGHAAFKKTVDQMADQVKQLTGGCLILSNEGCGRCKSCTYPDAPCRFPEKLYPSLEGFGFIVSELAAKAGIRYNNGSNTVTYFGAVFF